MTSHNAIKKVDSLDQIVNALHLEKEYFFTTQSKIQKITGCAFKDAQISSRNVIDRLSKKYAPNRHLHIPAIDLELGNLINIEVSQLKSAMSKNFDISEHDFIALVELLKRGDNSLFEKVFLKHFESCVNFVKRKFYISYDEAYDASMDALVHFRQKLIEDKIKYGNIRFLFTQIACQLYIKSKTKANKDQEAIQPIIEVEEEVDQFSLEVLNSSWQELGEGCKDLLTKIFYGNMKLTEIAKEVHKSDVAIRKQKQRCVGMLKQLFQKNQIHNQ